MSFEEDTQESFDQNLQDRIDDLEERLLNQSVPVNLNVSERDTGLGHSKLQTNSSGISFPLLYELDDHGTVGGRWSCRSPQGRWKTERFYAEKEITFSRI